MPQFCPGEAVYVKVGLIKHYGIVTELGTIINSSKRRGAVMEETIESFSEGRQILRASFQAALAPHEVINRARSKLGERWRLLDENCEHFVRWALGLKKTSEQVVGWMLAGLLTYLLTRK